MTEILMTKNIFAWTGIMIFAACFLSCADPVVLEHTLDASTSVRIRAFKDWEISVPVYLEVIRKNREDLKSGPFYFYAPESIESKSLEIDFKEIDGVLIVYKKDEPDIILSMVDPANRLVYPPNTLKDDAYYRSVEKLFSKLKDSLENDQLKLNR